MNRNKIIEEFRGGSQWDVVIIGGGATGVGCAVDAASRGFKVLLLERHDFGKGTSSRSTKLVHGGVRYLQQGDISMVRESLGERGVLEQNAPHIVARQAFIVPCYSLWSKYYYGAGLKIYDRLSGKQSFGKSAILSRKETLTRLPNLEAKGLSGGVLYFDGRFDDTRLLTDLTRTASKNGARLLNYARVFGLLKDSAGKVRGVKFECAESGDKFRATAEVVINATGAFCNEIRKLSSPVSESLVSTSQGIHLVFDRSFLAGNDAIMIPKTSDGRVLFAIPWHNNCLVGTTDTPIAKAKIEPKPLEEEIDFVLENCANYFSKSPGKTDILSAFAGIRPLVNSSTKKDTASLSRDHLIEIDESNLITITGGKWTTYRRMAEDAINNAIRISDLPDQPCVTRSLRIEDNRPGDVVRIISENPMMKELLDEDFPYQKAEVISSVRNEMARTVEDFLARRVRILFLDANAAIRMSRDVAELMSAELGKDEHWINHQVEIFRRLAKNYLVNGLDRKP